MVSVLVADDRIVSRRGLRALLETCQNFEVCAEACNGREAVELAISHNPDVVVLEIALPIIDGIEATRRIRHQRPETEVMILTSQDRDATIRDVLHAGARGYVLKSEPEEQIVLAIESLARHRSYFSRNIPASVINGFRAASEIVDQSRTLTAREREVIRLIADGKSNKSVAYLLDISIKTVESHRAAAMRKLSVHSTAELVRYAIRCKLISP